MILIPSGKKPLLYSPNSAGNVLAERETGQSSFGIVPGLGTSAPPHGRRRRDRCTYFFFERSPDAPRTTRQVLVLRDVVSLPEDVSTADVAGLELDMAGGVRRG